MIVLLALFVLSAAGVGAAFAVPGWSDLLLLAGPCLGASLFLLLRLRWRAGRATAVPDRPRVVIDGSNVLYWQDNTPGIAPVRQVVARLEVLGYLPGVMFDANAGYLIAGKYLDDAAFIRLVGLPLAQIVVVPKGTQADGHILTAARDLGARIVTNDRYRDWADQFPEVRAPGHLIRGGYRDGVLWLDVADRGAPVLVPAASRTIQGKPSSRVVLSSVPNRRCLLGCGLAAGASVGDAAGSIAAIRFGSEGQFWRMTPVAEFPGHLSAVPFLRDRLQIVLAEGGAG